MKIFGLDFTSAPSRIKPITCAICSLDSEHLEIEGFETFPGFDGFERFLKTGGPWVAGIDFPFGLPRQLIENLKWPLSWGNYVAKVKGMTRNDFVDLLTEYKSNRPYGDKEHRRTTDKRAGSLSPMKLYGVPVGKMFFEGAPRILKSKATVLPFMERDSDRIIIEAYPALVARKFIGTSSYKSDDKRNQENGRLKARCNIVAGIKSNLFRHYNLRLSISEEFSEIIISDHSGDRIDAVLAAIQAAWAYTKREDGFGIPEDVDRLEGWIIDPWTNR